MSDKVRVGGVEVLVDRGATFTLDELDGWTVALDGAVRGPQLDAASMRLSLDHHDGCVRLVTSATCVQALDLLNVGFDPAGCTVVVNDVDGDTVLSVVLLAYPELLEGPSASTVFQLVHAVGKVDAHGPGYRLPGDAQRVADRFFTDVMAPEQDHRHAGTYGTCDLAELLVECVSNTVAFIDGNLESRRPRASAPIEVLHEGTGWAVARSAAFGFDELYRLGFDGGVIANPQVDGTTAYTVGRRSDLVASFPVPEILAALAAVEPGWGGGSSIGGAPRNADGSRSRLTVEEVHGIVTDVVNAAQR